MIFFVMVGNKKEVMQHSFKYAEKLEKSLSIP